MKVADALRRVVPNLASLEFEQTIHKVEEEDMVGFRSLEELRSNPLRPRLPVALRQAEFQVHTLECFPRPTRLADTPGTEPPDDPVEQRLSQPGRHARVQCVEKS